MKLSQASLVLRSHGYLGEERIGSVALYLLSPPRLSEFNWKMNLQIRVLSLEANSVAIRSSNNFCFFPGFEPWYQSSQAFLFPSSVISFKVFESGRQKRACIYDVTGKRSTWFGFLKNTFKWLDRKLIKLQSYKYRFLHLPVKGNLTFVSN